MIIMLQRTNQYVGNTSLMEVKRPWGSTKHGDDDDDMKRIGTIKTIVV
jgi:hypothetical protein